MNMKIDTQRFCERIPISKASENLDLRSSALFILTKQQWLTTMGVVSRIAEIKFLS